ncbi:MAG: pseudouridine synthase [Thermoanaerobaculia bacterium]
MAAERLQKLLSSAGIASRRDAEEMIRQGRVTVNGKKVLELGAKADLEEDHVKVDGKLIRLPTERRYIVLNKPRGFVVTRDDPQNRPTVYALIGGRVGERVVPVGRLDADSEGLLVMTNDGDLVQKLTHPSGGCRKEYEVKVSGVPTPAQISRLARGVVLGDGKRTAPAEIELMETTPEKNGVGGNAWLKVILGEGRSRQIRRMFELVGHQVSKLRRVAIGPLRDKNLKPGVWRDLSESEVHALQSIRPASGAGSASTAKSPARPARPAVSNRTRVIVRPLAPGEKPPAPTHRPRPRPEAAPAPVVAAPAPPPAARTPERSRTPDRARSTERPRVSERPRLSERPRPSDRPRPPFPPRSPERSGGGPDRPSFGRPGARNPGPGSGGRSGPGGRTNRS